MSRTSYKKKSLGGKIATAVVCVVVLAVVGLGSAWGTGFALTGKANPAEWTSSTPTTPRTVAVTNDGQALTNGCTYDMPEGLAFLSARAVSTETLEYVAGGEITLTATLSNEYINGKFDWSADFANSSSAWAQGKVTSYYLGLELIDGGRQVKLNYLAPFSEQIILTATLQGTESSASCTIDCVKSALISCPTFTTEDFGEVPNAEAQIVFGEGTVIGNFSNGVISVGMEEDFIEEVNSYLNFPIKVKRFRYEADPKFFGNSNYLCIARESGLAYSDFIEGFEDYDQDHKDAIYYAWYRADQNYGSGKRSFLFDISVEYYCADVLVERLMDSDVLGGRISGYEFGSEVSPSVTLNKNYAF